MENKVNNLRMEAAKKLSEATGKTIEEALRTLGVMDSLSKTTTVDYEVACTK